MSSSSESWEPQIAPTSLALTCRWRSRPQHHFRTHAPQQKASLFDHPLGGGKNVRVEFQPERLGGLEVDHELDLCGLDDWQVCRLLALENPPGVDAGLAKGIGQVRSVAHQAADLGPITV